jgi:hypothetical protein
MHCELVPGRYDFSQQAGAAPSDMRARQQRAVQHGPPPVRAHGLSAAHLFEKSRPEHATDRTARVVGPDGNEKARAHGQAVEQPQ